MSENITEAVDVEVVLETVVRCTEIDVNGHVNNAEFVEYLEWGREGWYERHGFAYDRLEELGAVTVVVEHQPQLPAALPPGRPAADRHLAAAARPYQLRSGTADHEERWPGCRRRGCHPCHRRPATRAGPYRCQRSSPGCSASRD